MDDIICVRKPVTRRVICTLSYSYSDVRRLSALRAKDRLKDLVLIQSKTIEKQGMRCVLNNSYKHPLPGMNQFKINIITSRWEDVLRLGNLYGKHLLIYVFEKCPKIKALHLNLYQLLLQSAEQSDQRASKCTCKLLRYISCVVFNFDRAFVVDSTASFVFEKLKHQGYTPEMIHEASAAFLDFMAEYFSRSWTKNDRVAWQKAMDIFCEIGKTEWKCNLEQGEMFRSKKKKTTFRDSKQMHTYP